MRKKTKQEIQDFLRMIDAISKYYDISITHIDNPSSFQLVDYDEKWHSFLQDAELFELTH